MGPNHIVEMLNSGFQVFGRAGGVVVPQITHQAFWSALGTLPGQPAARPFDPKTLYDQYTDRWVVTADGWDGGANSWVLVGISQTNTPTGAWNLYAILASFNDAGAGVDHTNDWADVPGLGVDPNNVVVTNNVYTMAANPAYVHADVWVIDKASLIAGAGPLVQGVDYALFHDPCQAPEGPGFTYRPCHTFGQTAANAVNYLVDEGWLDLATTTRRFIRVKDIFGVGAGAVLGCRGGNDWVEVPGYNFWQLNAPQPLCSALINTNDPRLLNAVLWKDRIWTTHSVGVGVVPWPSPGPSKTEVSWYEIDPAQAGAFPGGVPNQQGRVSDPDLYYYFPSIAVNKELAVALGFSGSDENTFVSAYYTIHDPAVNGPGVTQPVSLLKAGVDSYWKTFQSPSDRNRWGDYSSTVVDPRDWHTFWTVQEYAEAQFTGVPPPSTCDKDQGRWGTWWGSFHSANPIDGWFISFHEPLAKGDPQSAPLALYYCDVKVVDIDHTKLPDCQDHQIFEYLVNLDNCCLVQASVDSRTGLMPATKDAFYEEKCLEYDIDIQAVVGLKYYQDPVTGSCIVKKTGKSAADNFWGWHTTANERALRSALTGTVKVAPPDDEWLHGPWTNVAPKCSWPNMAYELLTMVPGTTKDSDDNGIPDQCECLPTDPPVVAPGAVDKNRVISFVPQNGGQQTAIRINLVTLYDEAVCPPRPPWIPDVAAYEGEYRWVGRPHIYAQTEGMDYPTCDGAGPACDCQPQPPVDDGTCQGGLEDGQCCCTDDDCKPADPSDLGLPHFMAAELRCETDAHYADWSALLGGDALHLFGDSVLPCSTYEVQEVDIGCPNLTVPGAFSAPLGVSTAKWGDVTTPFHPGPPDQPDFRDIAAVVDKFTGRTPPHKVAAVLQPNVPEMHVKVGFLDIAKVVDAFIGTAYLEDGPSACP